MVEDLNSPSIVLKFSLEILEYGLGEVAYY